eukprot:SAG22_NODE_2946_length_2084_cov_1.864987_2_plen_402_part_00
MREVFRKHDVQVNDIELLRRVDAQERAQVRLDAAERSSSSAAGSRYAPSRRGSAADALQAAEPPSGQDAAQQQQPPGGDGEPAPPSAAGAQEAEGLEQRRQKEKKKAWRRQKQCTEHIEKSEAAARRVRGLAFGTEIWHQRENSGNFWLPELSLRLLGEAVLLSFGFNGAAAQAAHKPLKIDLPNFDTADVVMSFGMFLQAMLQVEGGEQAGAEPYFQSKTKLDIFKSAVAPVSDAYDALAWEHGDQGGQLLRHRLRFVNFRLLQLIEFLDVGAYAQDADDALFTKLISERLAAETTWEFRSKRSAAPQVESAAMSDVLLGGGAAELQNLFSAPWLKTKKQKKKERQGAPPPAAVLPATVPGGGPATCCTSLDADEPQPEPPQLGSDKTARILVFWSCQRN